jgi:broad specificity phosphatase PhoE
VACFDATNTSRERRAKLLKEVKTWCEEHGKRIPQVIFLESQCSDEATLLSNMKQKVTNSPDYANLPTELALADLQKRIEAYQRIYSPVDEAYEDQTSVLGPISYIKTIDLSSKIIARQVFHPLAFSLLGLLVSIHIGSRPIFLVRAGQCTDDDVRKRLKASIKAANAGISKSASNNSLSGRGGDGPAASARHSASSERLSEIVMRRLGSFSSGSSAVITSSSSSGMPGSPSQSPMAGPNSIPGKDSPGTSRMGQSELAAGLPAEFANSTFSAGLTLNENGLLLAKQLTNFLLRRVSGGRYRRAVRSAAASALAAIQQQPPPGTLLSPGPLTSSSSAAPSALTGIQQPTSYVDGAGGFKATLSIVSSGATSSNSGADSATDGLSPVVAAATAARDRGNSVSSFSSATTHAAGLSGTTASAGAPLLSPDGATSPGLTSTGGKSQHGHHVSAQEPPRPLKIQVVEGDNSEREKEGTTTAAAAGVLLSSDAPPPPDTVPTTRAPPSSLKKRASASSSKHSLVTPAPSSVNLLNNNKQQSQQHLPSGSAVAGIQEEEQEEEEDSDEADGVVSSAPVLAQTQVEHYASTATAGGSKAAPSTSAAKGSTGASGGEDDDDLLEVYDADPVIYTSTLPRTIQMASLFPGEAGLDYQIQPMSCLNPLDTGVGVPIQALKESGLSSIYEAWLRSPDKAAYRFPGGESLNDVMTRLAPFVLEVERSRKPVVIISHLSILQVLLAYFSGCPLADSPSIPVPINSVIELRPHQYGWIQRVHKFTKVPGDETVTTSGDDGTSSDEDDEEEEQLGLPTVS